MSSKSHRKEWTGVSPKMQRQQVDQKMQILASALMSIRKGSLRKRLRLAAMILCGYTSDRPTIRERLWQYACIVATVVAVACPCVVIWGAVR